MTANPAGCKASLRLWRAFTISPLARDGALRLPVAQGRLFLEANSSTISENTAGLQGC